MKTCFRCDNGKQRYELVDRAGIFCTYVCEDCEKSVRAGYNPAIFDGYLYNGDEESLEAEDYVRG